MAVDRNGLLEGQVKKRTRYPSEVSAPPPKPLLRGWLHEGAVFLAVPAAIYLLADTRPGAVRVGVAIYVVALIGLFGTSAAYHRITWSARGLRIMRSLDHSMIFFLIAATHTAFAMIVLNGVWRWVVLGLVWAGTTLGIAFKLIRIDGFARVGGTLYIALGWLGVATMPAALRHAGVWPLILIAAGGLMYTAGAFVLLKRRPDPNPLVFGYHEVWHALVVLASACQYGAITLMLRAGS